MFKKLKKKIFLSLFIVPTIFLILISIVLISSLYFLYSNDFRNNFSTNTKLCAERIKLQLELLSSEAFSFADNVNSYDTESYAMQLDQIYNSHEMIIGAYFYQNGMIYNSTNLGEVKTYEKVIKDPEVINFYNTNQISSFAIRTQGLPNTHGFVPYSPELGQLSFLVKTKNNSLLIIDFDTSTIYDTIINFDSYQYFNNYKAVIVSESGTVLANYNTEYDHLEFIKSEQIKKKGKNYTIATTIENDSLPLYLFVSVPTINIEKSLILTEIGILTSDILIIFILLLLSNVFAKRKETQLIKLKTSMKEDISDLPTF